MQPPVPPAGSASALDAARQRLAGVAELSTTDQVSAFDEIHRLLQDALADVEQAVRHSAHPGGDGTHAAAPR